MAWLRHRLPTLVLPVALVTIALVSWQCHKRDSSSNADGAASGEPVPVEAIIAERADVDRVVDIAGTVQPMIRAEIAPRVMGRILDVGVKEGDSITAGMLLAKLDDAQAQAKAQEARSAVGAAEAKVNQAQVAMEIQKAQTEIRIAQARHSQDLTKAGARDEQKAQADQAVTQAEAAIAAAQAQAGLLNEGSRKQDKAQADESVKQAEAALAQAKANLDKAKNGPRSQEVERARQAVAQSEAAKRQADAGLDKAKEGARKQEKAQADESVSLAEAEYGTVHASFLRMKALHEAEVISDQAFEESQLKERAAAGKLEIAKQQASLVYEGSRTQDLAAAEEQVKQAAAGAEQAKQHLAELQEGTRPEDIAASEQQVRQAEAIVEQSKQRADLVKEGSRPQEIQQAEEALHQAQAMGEIARKQRDLIYAGARPEELSLAEDGVKLAESAGQETGLRQKDVEAAAAVAEQARASLQAAEVAIADSAIMAPFDAVVTKRLADPGDMATPGTPILVLQPIGQFEIQCTVPEAQVRTLSIGQALETTIDAVSPTPISATVASIVPLEDVSNRSSVVKLGLPPAEGLKTGLFGRVAVPVGTRKGIYIPQSAVWQHESLTGVFLLDRGHAKLRLVRLGRPRGDRIEVISGLEGAPEDPEKVIVSDISLLVDGTPVCPKVG